MPSANLFNPRLSITLDSITPFSNFAYTLSSTLNFIFFNYISADSITWRNPAHFSIVLLKGNCRVALKSEKMCTGSSLYSKFIVSIIMFRSF